MATYEQHLDVHVPLDVAYNQWTQFEEFPAFMEGVKSVTQVSDTRNHWVAEIAGVEREFETEIIEQRPDEYLAWYAVDGPHHAGSVTFQHLDEETTRVILHLEFDPNGFLETVADKLGFVRSRVERDLQKFQGFIESRGRETGAWRGEVDAPYHVRGE